MLTNKQVIEYNTNGFLHIQNVFSPEEVEHLKQACESYNAGEVLGIPEFNKILLDDRIVSTLKSILGDEIVYFGESMVSKDEKSRDMHNDSKRDDFDFDKKYTVVRIGIYLQDYKNYSGGLKLRPGSHKKFCIDKYGFKNALQFAARTGKWFSLLVGKSYNVPTKPGDLLLWNMRTHHSGHAVRIKGMQNHSFHPWIENLFPVTWHKTDSTQRYVIFASYGTPSDYLENYIIDRVNRPNMARHWSESKKNRFDSVEIATIANSANVTLRCDGLYA